MTELFGGFTSEFYGAYQGLYPVDSGYAQRKLIYQLYHILLQLVWRQLCHPSPGTSIYCFRTSPKCDPTAAQVLLVGHSRTPQVEYSILRLIEAQRRGSLLVLAPQRALRRCGAQAQRETSVVSPKVSLFICSMKGQRTLPGFLQRWQDNLLSLENKLPSFGLVHTNT